MGVAVPRSIPEWIATHDDQAIPLLTRLRVFERYAGVCQGPCNRKLTPRDKHIHFDHIVPLADGGQHREQNLQILCEGCHGLKTGIEASARARTRSIRARAYGIGEQTPWSKSYHAMKARGYNAWTRTMPQKEEQK